MLGDLVFRFVFLLYKSIPHTTIGLNNEALDLDNEGSDCHDGIYISWDRRPCQEGPYATIMP